MLLTRASFYVVLLLCYLCVLSLSCITFFNLPRPATAAATATATTTTATA